MPTKLKDNIDIQPIDFRYDEGIRGRVDINSAPTITTKTGGNSGQSMVAMRERESMLSSNLKIRKLTPLECLKLQGFTEEDYKAIKDHFSDSAIYHCAGDSISTTVEIALFGSMTNLDYRHIINEYVEKEVIEIGSRTI